jgi:hypothetical protein
MTVSPENSRQGIPEGFSNIPALLRTAIQMSGKSQYAFARAAGMSPTQLHACLKPGGRQMRLSNIRELLEANGLVAEVTMLHADNKLASRSDASDQQLPAKASDTPQDRSITDNNWKWRSMLDEDEKPIDSPQRG